MATGRLGASDLTAAALTTVYTCPADTFAIVAVNFLNRGNQAQTFRLAVATTGTPTLVSTLNTMWKCYPKEFWKELVWYWQQHKD
jgi:hypothetical protein